MVIEIRQKDFDLLFHKGLKTIDGYIDFYV